MIAQVIQAAKTTGRKIGICGQAPSDYPECAQFLMEQGIDSISLNPDAVLQTLVEIAAIEQPLVGHDGGARGARAKTEARAPALP